MPLMFDFGLPRSEVFELIYTKDTQAEHKFRLHNDIID